MDSNLFVWGSGGINENHKAIKIQCTFRGYASRHRDKLDYKKKTALRLSYKNIFGENAIHYVATSAMREASAIADTRMIRGALGKICKRRYFL